MIAPAFPDVTVLLPDSNLGDRTKVGHVFSTEDLEAIERAREALAELEGYRFDYVDRHAQLLDRLRSRPPAFVLNLCDTGFGNVAARELHVPALLEVFDVPYSGCPPACLGLCFDKANVLAIAADCDIPVPRQRLLAAGETWDDDGFPVPALVKPNRADGGFGITASSVATDASMLRVVIARLQAELPGLEMLVQEFLDGDEYGVGLVGNRGLGFAPLPALVVDWSELPAELPRILGYESKTLPDSPYWTKLRYRVARLAADEEARLHRHAEVLFERLGCRDCARFDFRAGADGVIKLLEVNPNPAWCWDGKLNLMAEHAGMSYAELLCAILDAAQCRVRAAR